jgi:hypothetical protein
MNMKRNMISFFFTFPSNGAPVEWNWQGKTEVLGENPVPVPLCPPQIPHGLTRDQTQASAVGGRRLTACVMARPSSLPYTSQPALLVDRSFLLATPNRGRPSPTGSNGLGTFIKGMLTPLYRTTIFVTVRHGNHEHVQCASWCCCMKVSKTNMPTADLQQTSLNVHFALCLSRICSQGACVRTGYRIRGPE